MSLLLGTLATKPIKIYYFIVITIKIKVPGPIIRIKRVPTLTTFSLRIFPVISTPTQVRHSHPLDLDESLQALNKNPFPSLADGTCISNPCWNYVAGANGTQAIIFDLYNGTATGLTAKNIHVKPDQASYDSTTVICDPTTLVPGEQETLGFLCQNGTYVETPIST